MTLGPSAALVALSAIGIHRLLLTAAYLARRGHVVPAAGPAPLPAVTVQLPIYNERFVAERLIAAACALDYPRDLLQIQVLDDSTDATRELARAAVDAARTRGVDAVYLHREDRNGYKAGALAAGLAQARGELFLVLDADFHPRPDLLARTVALFADPRVGFVQLRWHHANRGASFLTRTAALLLDGHFIVEHHARFALGHLFNFNGTAGVLRRSAIEQAGGWQSDTLTEDLDLSYRMQIAGWRGIYMKDLTCPGDLPEAMADFKGQQRRWVEGSIQTARKLMRPLLASPLPALARLEAALHLLTNFAYPLMLAGFVLLVGALVSGVPAAAPAAAAMSAAGTAGVLLFYAVAHRESGAPTGPGALLAALALGSGLAVSNSLAVVRGLLRRGGHFERTPKLAGAAERPPGYRSRVGWTPLLELALGAYLASGVALAIARGLPVAAAFLAVFATGALWVGAASLSDGR